MEDVLEVWFEKRRARDKDAVRKPKEKRMSKLFLNGDIVHSVVLNPDADFLKIKDKVQPIMKVDQAGELKQEMAS